MIRNLPSLAAALLMLSGGVSYAAEARLETGDILAYRDSLAELSAGMTGQEIADLNWQLTLIAFGDKPASMSDEDYAIATMTFMIEHSDEWLERLEPYDGWTAAQIMSVAH